MLNTPAVLEDLAQRIAEQEAVLARLRRDLEARQQKLARLNERRASLQARLQKTEAEIQAVAGSTTSSSPPATPSQQAKAGTSSAGHKPVGEVTLGDFLLNVVREAGRPVTARELAQEVERRKFPTKSHNVRFVVKNCVSKLVKKGLLRRAKDQPGVVLASGSGNMQRGTTKAAEKPHVNGRIGKDRTEAASPAKVVKQGTKVPLSVVILEALGHSTQPLPARELGEQVLARGYQTKSKEFTNVIWVAVSKIPNVENVPGQGYRLKKGAGQKGEGKGGR